MQPETPRYFDCEWGIHYTLVARDEDHARAILYAYAFDVEDTRQELGDPELVEVPAEVAAQRMCFDGKDDTTKPLTAFAIGDFLSSEY